MVPEYCYECMYSFSGKNTIVSSMMCCYFQVITKCCCYLRTMRYNLSAFDEHWEGCAKVDVKECTDEKSGKSL